MQAYGRGYSGARVWDVKLDLTSGSAQALMRIESIGEVFQDDVANTGIAKVQMGAEKGALNE